MAPPDGTAPLLTDIVAVELGDGLASAYCGRWLRLHGARVVRVVDAASGGDRLRREDLTPDGWRRTASGSMFAALHAGKEFRTLDLKGDAGRRELEALLGEAQVVVQSWRRSELRARGIEPLVLEPSGERIVVSCTPLGLDGLYAEYQVTDEIELALSGAMYVFGESGEPPQSVRVPMVEYMGGLYGFVSVLLGLLAPEAGTRFDVASVDCLAVNLEKIATFYSHLGVVHGRGHGLQRHFSGHPSGVYPCKDGYVMIALGHSPISMIGILVDDPSLEEHRTFQDRSYRQRNPHEFDALILPWFTEHSAEEIVTKANELRMPFGYVLSPEDLLSDPQLLARDHFVTAEFEGSDERIALPGLPYRYRDLDRAGGDRAPLIVPSMESKP